MTHSSATVLYRWDQRFIRGAGASEICMRPERLDLDTTSD